MKRLFTVHYYLLGLRIEFECPYCGELQHMTGDGIAADGQPHPQPRDVVLRHLYECPKVWVGETFEFEPVIHKTVQRTG
jgi:hypothetical protein